MLTLKERCRVRDLYPPERQGLFRVFKGTDSVLDIGCGSGGMSEIWHDVKNRVEYIGIDEDSELIRKAQEKYPDTFYQGEYPKQFSEGSYLYDTVMALGVLHWNEAWRRMLQSMWKQCRKYCFFDVRMSALNPSSLGRQVISVSETGKQEVPYLVLDPVLLLNVLRGLDPTPRGVFQYGYWGAPGEGVRGVSGEVYFNVLVLEKFHDSDLGLV